MDQLISMAQNPKQIAKTLNATVEHVMSLGNKLEQNFQKLEEKHKKIIRELEDQGITLQDITRSLNSIKGTLDNVDQNQKKTLKVLYEQNTFMDELSDQSKGVSRN